jgi:hypothetical protein
MREKEVHMKLERVVVGLAILMSACAAHSVRVLDNHPADESAIRKLEEEFRLAKVENDTATLERDVAEDYYGLNQNGTPRNKEQLVELFKKFKIQSLQVDVQRVRISGDDAIVAGRQREVMPCRTSDCPSQISLFVRTYVRRGGRWQLYSNAHYVDPNDGRPSGTAYAHDSW